MAAPRLLKPGGLSALGGGLAPGAHRLPAAEVRALLGADEIVAAAEARAAEILAAAEAEREAERARGHAEGLAEGRAQVLRALIEEQAACDRALGELEADVAQVAIDIARAVIGAAAEADVAAALAARALREMRRARRAELRVAPALAPALRARVAEILADHPEIELLDVIEDAALEGAAVVLESRVGRVDADPELLLDAFAAHLRRPGAAGPDAAP